PPPLTMPAPAVSALLLLMMALTTTFACQDLNPQDDSFAWDSIKTLKTMAPSPSQPCQHQQEPFLFPSTLLRNNHPQQAANTAQYILEKLLDIFSRQKIPHHWDTLAHQSLLINLHHYIHHLEQCWPAKRILNKRQGPHNRMLTLNKYFRSIHSFLQTHNHSACAWDQICLEAHYSFKRVDMLIRQMK
ncbi:IFN protein, partial [Turnix velox]|nr:IFN protein [Turnix velox]